METASIVASFVSLIVGGFAVWLSLYFYTQAKNSERNVQVALEGIKTQTDALQALNARTLDRLTKYVTTPRDEPTQSIQVLFAAIRELPDLALKLRPPTTQSSDEALRREVTSTYIALWNYTGLSNIWASFSLPPAESFDPADSFDQLVKSVVDRSCGDFNFLSTIIDNLSQDEIRQSPYFHMYEEAHTRFRELVGDTAFHFARKAKQQKPNG